VLGAPGGGLSRQAPVRLLMPRSTLSPRSSGGRTRHSSSTAAGTPSSAACCASASYHRPAMRRAVRTAGPPRAAGSRVNFSKISDCTPDAPRRSNAATLVWLQARGSLLYMPVGDVSHIDPHRQ
jgi:hypothetical protein